MHRGINAILLVTPLVQSWPWDVYSVPHGTLSVSLRYSIHDFLTRIKSDFEKKGILLRIDIYVKSIFRNLILTF